MAPSSADPIRDLLAMSQAAGKEESWVLHGGGNSSVKGWHVSRTGKRVRALWVKASGSDLRTLREKDLAPLDLGALLQLRRFDALEDEAMLEELALASLKVGAPRGSIETLLHASTWWAIPKKPFINASKWKLRCSRF